jgi:UDP-glucose 4-epimerase
MFLVTGSAGHLGEALIRSLRAAGHAALGVDLKPSRFTDRVGSICDESFIEDCMQGAHSVVHAASLHKPHIATHRWRDFIDTNVTGTLVLLEAAVAAQIRSFIYLSTTSAFGSSLIRTESSPAIWVTEELASGPRNIYGASKVMAENLCELTHKQCRLPIVVLRTSRFFPEDDDNPDVRRHYEPANAQANELLYRRVDIEDVVSAVMRASERAPDIGFAKYIVSATTPFRPDDVPVVGRDAPRVIRDLFPDSAALYCARGWSFFPQIDRVYVNDRARRELGWTPRYDFAYVLKCLQSNQDFRSSLARDVGRKGYHERSFADGPYPLAHPPS